MRLPARSVTFAFVSTLLLFAALPAQTKPESAKAPSELPAKAPAAHPPSEELLQRSEKIVTKLGLASPEQQARIRDLVAQQYAELALIHDARDEALKVAKAAASEPAAQSARDTATARQADLHYAFIARLSAELTQSQVEQIKDGITYGVLPNTFRVYQEMLPNLTPEQSNQILAWLTEAREHAMDAGSSKDKHAWFGKYKGRINNYLSKAGYDMKQAERDMFSRKNTEAKTSN
ncbi:DUF3826 domain-containing protein [bacterium]|jgi:Spy/CpxP family protein refolding chaperone|nr:DUF3826 domain-containing protein [bacterium]